MEELVNTVQRFLSLHHLRLLEGDYNFANGTQPVSDLEAKVPDPLRFSNLYRQIAGSDTTKVIHVPSLEEVCVC